MKHAFVLIKKLCQISFFVFGLFFFFHSHVVLSQTPSSTDITHYIDHELLQALSKKQLITIINVIYEKCEQKGITKQLSEPFLIVHEIITNEPSKVRKNDLIIFLDTFITLLKNYDSDEIRSPRDDKPSKPVGNCCCDFSEILGQLARSIILSKEIKEIVEEILALVRGCNATFIHQSDLGVTGYNIILPGVYKVAENLTFSPLLSPQNAITINSSNVLLDFQCFSLSQGNGTLNTNGVLIASAKTNVSIQNGLIQNFTGTGLVVQSNCQRFSVYSLTTFSCGIQGISIGSSGIRDGEINNCKVINCSNGVSGDIAFLLQGSNNVKVSDSSLDNNGLSSHSLAGLKVDTCSQCVFNTIDAIENVGSTVATFSIVNSSQCAFNNCTINATQATSGNCYGIFSDGDASNSYEACTIQNCSTLSTNTTTLVAGISLGPTAQGSKILDCTISNSTILTNAAVKTVGIFMQNTFTALSNNDLPALSLSTTVNSVAWSPDHRFLAAGFGTAPEMRVFEFVNNQLNQVAIPIGIGVINSVAWSPDGRFLAAGGVRSGTNNVRVFEFIGTQLTLNASFDTGATTIINTLAWSTDGRYLAVGGTATPQIQILEFTKAVSAPSTAGSLVLRASFTHGANINSVSWSSDNKFLAIGGVVSGGVEVRVLSFTNGTTLTSVATFAHGGTIQSVAFSPDNRFLAIGGATGGGVELRVLTFNGTALASLATFAHGATVQSVIWSSDGRYLSMAGVTGGGVEVRAFDFNNLTTLSPVSTFANGAQVNSISWSIDGVNIALGGAVGVSAQIRILSALNFPQGCIIQNNTVNGIQSGTLSFGIARGFGITASSGNNLVISNNTFNNNTNYCFVSNVFSQYKNNSQMIPSLYANLSFPPL